MEPNARRRNWMKTLAASGLGLAASVARAEDAPAEGAEAPPAAKPPVQQVYVQLTLLEWQIQNTTDFDFAVLFQGDPGAILNSADLTLPATQPLSSAARIFLDGMDTGHGSVDAVIEALETRGEVRVLQEMHGPVQVGATPGGEPEAGAGKGDYSGKFLSGARVPYESAQAFGGTRLATTTEYMQTGAALKCSAKEIKYGEFVLLQIDASVTDLTGFINIGLNDQNEPMRVPVVDTRELKNEVLVRDRSILIAGLLKSTRGVERRRGIPFISELPGLRAALTNVAQRFETVELVFLVRTEILDPVPQPP